MRSITDVGSLEGKFKIVSNKRLAKMRSLIFVVATGKCPTKPTQGPNIGQFTIGQGGSDCGAENHNNMREKIENHAKINISKLSFFWVTISDLSFEQSKYLKGLGLDTLTGLVSAFGIEQDPIPLDELSGLEEYVKRPDPNWSYSRVSECEEDTDHYTIYCVKMYSQKWLDSSVWYSPTHKAGRH